MNFEGFCLVWASQIPFYHELIIECVFLLLKTCCHTSLVDKDQMLEMWPLSAGKCTVQTD